MTIATPKNSLNVGQYPFDCDRAEIPLLSPKALHFINTPTIVSIAGQIVIDFRYFQGFRFIAGADKKSHISI